MSDQEVLTGTIDSDTRYKLTEAMLKTIRPSSELPKAFDVHQAANKDLLKHGLPSRPNAYEKPDQYAKWTRFTSKPTQYIAPTFKIISDDRTPVTSVGAAGGVSVNVPSGNWSGAVSLPPPAGESYNSCSGRWVVPN